MWYTVYCILTIISRKQARLCPTVIWTSCSCWDLSYCIYYIHSQNISALCLLCVSKGLPIALEKERCLWCVGMSVYENIACMITHAFMRGCVQTSRNIPADTSSKSSWFSPTAISGLGVCCSPKAGMVARTAPWWRLNQFLNFSGGNRHWQRGLHVRRVQVGMGSMRTTILAIGMSNAGVRGFDPCPSCEPKLYLQTAYSQFIRWNMWL